MSEEKFETDCFLFIKIDNKWVFFDWYKDNDSACKNGDIIINKKMADEYMVVNTEEIIKHCSLVEENKMKYGVFDNDKPASEEGFPKLKGKGWDSHIFNTWEKANEYAQKWLGQYAGEKLELGKPCDYSGYGDKILIKIIN